VPRHPWDFTVEKDGIATRVDVKSTSGPFENRIHISTNELLHMLDADLDYRVYRLYETPPRQVLCFESQSR